ncbi:MAG: Metalloprotease [Candidatus Methanoperedens nitroreducens]|uniref:Archaemetzincin n=1 Tax=Candidatus Methanoperedens nitratireducens TaxID=1392998 RepID=A0A0N8KQJ4_9EURY|nr:MAG: Metalloprotease [Candidatus Methanoperedens sp. BLZ1]
MQYIYIQPIGEIEKELLAHLAAELKKVYGYPCKVTSPIGVPEISYNADRRQYSAKVLVSRIMEQMPSDAKRLLGVIDSDLFVPGLNFIFGLAYGNTAVIALTRLRPEYYGEEKNERLFKERALKEAIHELGHTFGLAHCPDIRCVMHFSNKLADTDIKGPSFCRVCSARLVRR